MSTMGMLKTAISGRFGRGGQVLGGDIPSDIDLGASQPETPNKSKRDKRDKRDKRKKDTPKTKQVGPAVMMKKDNQELKHGHDPNKINSMLSKRHIIVEPSTRHMNYQASTRNLSNEPLVKSPQKSMRNMGDKKSSMRNTNGPDKKRIGPGPRVANVNVEAFENTISTLSKMGISNIDETISTASTLTSIDENNSTLHNQKALGRTPIMNRTNETSSSTQKVTTSKLDTISENPASPGGSTKPADSSSHRKNRTSPASTSMKSSTSTATTKSTSSQDIAPKLDLNPPASPRDSSNRSTKSRPKPPRKRGPSLVTPAHFNRERPSTVLITRKELEDILAEKQKEESMEAKTIPPKSGTMSTDLWLDAANQQAQSEEFSVASGTSVEEESPFRPKPKLNAPEDQYDISFFDITEEEEITEHTINSGTQSFDAGDLQFTDSIEQRVVTIRFDEYDELQTCLHINDYTNGEINRSWYKREDYDKMVDLARKTASKAVKREKELQEELEEMLRAGKKDDGEDKSNRSGRSHDGKRKKPIEYRGLEAWTPEGSQKCRTLKENAIELVWNEQSRQWEEGTFDPEAIAEVYMPVSKIALKAAYDKAIADEKMVKRLEEQELKKKNRSGFAKSRSAIKKTAKNTTKAVGHGVGKVLAETGKSAMKIGKRSGKALVATATLDAKMMKEAVKVRHVKKRRECKHELEVTTSKAAVERDIEELEESNSFSLQDSGSLPSYNPNPLDRRQLLQMQKPGHAKPPLPTTYEIDMNSELSSQDFRDNSYQSKESDSNVSSPKKKSKLKLLGLVPIPGTQKKYSEDRRAEREEKRKEKMKRRPSWEASMAAGKH